MIDQLIRDLIKNIFFNKKFFCINLIFFKILFNIYYPINKKMFLSNSINFNN